jgi:hypothetical protein
MKSNLLPVLLIIVLAFFVLFFENFYPKEQTFVIESKSLKFYKDSQDIYIDEADIPVPSDGWIVQISYKLEGAGNDELHHLFLLNQNRKDMTCQSMDERIFAMGPEATDGHFPKLFGYRVSKSEKLRLIAHIHLKDSEKRQADNLKLKLYLQFQPQSILSSKIDLQPLFLDTVNCSYDPSFVVDPGVSETLSEKSYIVPDNKKIAFVGGHLHKYGTKIDLMLNEKPFWQATPTINSQGEVIKMPVAVYYGMKELKKADRVWLKSEYNNLSNSASDGMGILIVFLIK